MRDRVQIKGIAKFQFQQRLGMSIGAAFLYGLLTASFDFNYRFNSNQPIFDHSFINVITIIGGVFWLAYIFVGTAVSVGYAQFTRRIYCNEFTNVGDMFDTSFRDYWRNVGGILWMDLFIFLWSLLFVIPGIVKAYAYYLTPYIIAEYPNVPVTEALKISMRMTDGHKGELFVMSLSFLGWFLLSALTLGILGLVYVNPYYYTSMAGMYVELKGNALASGRVRYEELTYPYGPASYQ